MFLEGINFVRLFSLGVLILVEIDVLCSTCKYILPINDMDFHCRVKVEFKARYCNNWKEKTAVY